MLDKNIFDNTDLRILFCESNLLFMLDDETHFYLNQASNALEKNLHNSNTLLFKALHYAWNDKILLSLNYFDKSLLYN